MPIHEFTCKSCQHSFELLIMNRDEIDQVRCPKCQSPEVDKLMSAANVSVSSGGSSGASQASGGPSVQSHTCSTGSCTSFELPGHKR